jgi:hypothetical protein
VQTTFWITFKDPDKPRSQQFLGVAIIDVKTFSKKRAWKTVLRKAWNLGINPGGECMIQMLGPENTIPAEHKHKLITDEELLIKLGSAGRRPAALS